MRQCHCNVSSVVGCGSRLLVNEETINGDTIRKTQIL